jgi:3-deoxy-D-manno-octulosonic-acid transferase
VRLLYTFGIQLYVLLVHIASIFSTKAKLWVNGRKNWKKQLQKAIPPDQKVIWFHCASLGEFEQARPILEAYKAKHPNEFVLLSFFSPSGYEIRKGYKLADYICYMPADFMSNAQSFVKIAKPEKAVFVKYEFWYNFLSALYKSGCKTYLIAARFRPDQPFFKWYGSWFKKQLSHFHKIHVQDKISAERLERVGFSKYIVSGDPRFDRVSQNVAQTIELPEIKKWLNGRSCMVAGSAWPADEKIFLPWNNPRALIIAPHEIDETHLKSIEAQGGRSILRYSKLLVEPNATSDILLIDNIGMLMRIYAMADFAYVGGGFGTGLHNILEPAAFGIPVVFGPIHHKFPEANAMLQAGGAKEVSNKSDFQAFLNLMDSEKKAEMSNKSLLFVQSQTGATTLIINDLEK